MLNCQERSKLMRQWKEEDVPAATVVAKCAAGLLIIFGIALIAVYSPAPTVASNQVAASSQ